MAHICSVALFYGMIYTIKSSQLKNMAWVKKGEGEEMVAIFKL